MDMLERARQRLKELDQQAEAQRKKEEAESRQRYRPDPDSLPLKKQRLPFGAFAAFGWACFIGLSFINNAGFWEKYVIFPYLLLAIPLLLFTRGWIQMLFLTQGDLSVKAYRRSIGQCKSSAKALLWLWGFVSLAETFYLLFRRSGPLVPELGFLFGCLLSTALSAGFERCSRGLRYALWDPDAPTLR